MAYSEITVIKCSDMATVAAGGNSTASAAFSSEYGVKLTTAGQYVKCTGLDPTRLMFMVTRNSSETDSAFGMNIISGSTDGNIDYEQGKYSTVRNFAITILGATNFKNLLSTSLGDWNIQFFRIPNTAQFLDTDQYIKMTPDVGLTSATNKCHGAKVACFYLPA